MFTYILLAYTLLLCLPFKVIQIVKMFTLSMRIGILLRSETNIVCVCVYQESQWYKSQFESKVPKTRNVDVQVQGKMNVLEQAGEKFAFCSGQAIKIFNKSIWLPILMTAVYLIYSAYLFFFTQSTNSNANFFWSHPHRHT